jgi:predicted secreted hydrolase
MVRSYGFELVTFQFRLFGPTPVYVGNFAVTDLGRKAFHYASATGPSSQPQSPGRFSLSTGTWTMSGSSGDDTLRAAMPGYSIDLAQHSTEPAALEGPGGTISLGPLGPAHYYSWTSLATSGTMVDHGVSLRVTGRSWMDHEWSNTLSGAAGWDWFSVQLDNGTQYMLQFIRTKRAGIVAASGTRVRAAGVDYLTKGRIGEQASGSWTSPVTGYTYARHWRLRVPGGDLEVAPLLADQEVDLRKVQGTVYWEGDCVITGTIGGKPVTGVGYTEINPPGQLG